MIMKKGDLVLLSWECMYGPIINDRGTFHRRGVATCEVVQIHKCKPVNGLSFRPFTEVQIRDPKGKLWWTPLKSLKPAPRKRSKPR